MFRLENGDNVPLSSGMVSVELVGESAPLFDPDLVTHAADAVFFYFKHELGRESVSVGEFPLGAGNRPAKGFQVNSGNCLAKAADEPGLAQRDLGTLFQVTAERIVNCSFSGGFLRNELRSQLRDVAEGGSVPRA